MITHEFTSKRFQFEKLGQRLSRLVSCAIHFIPIMVLKSVNQHAAGTARAASTDDRVAPVCCCAADTGHSARQLPQHQTGPYDYRIF